MTDLNNVSLIGRLVKTPELRKVGENFNVLDFTLAVNKSYKKKDSEEWIDKVSFIDCSVTGPMAERRAQAKWMTKGNPVCVTGSISQDRWEKDGQKFSRIFVSCDSVSQVPLQKSESAPESADTNPDTAVAAPSDADLAAEYEQSDIF